MIDPTQPFTSDDIRGWMPLEYLMERLDLSQDKLYALLSLPEDLPPGTALRDLVSQIQGFGVQRVRDVVAAHQGQ